MCYLAPIEASPSTSAAKEDSVEISTLLSLQQQVRSPLITPTHASYNEARRLWNGMFDRRPLLIVQPESAAEVAATIAFAREHDLPLSVKGGGHGVAGKAVCDDGVVIDLTRMAAVNVDPTARVATVLGGATLRALDAASQAHGLATTAGIFRETGVVGLALGGGVGVLMRRFGLTCDNLLSAEVVTANGQIIGASESENPDLLWGLRGGGGNFGVATRMDFQLHPLRHVFGGRMVYRFEDAVAVGNAYREVMEDAPEDLQAYLSYSVDSGEKSVSIMLCNCGPRDAGERALASFRQFSRPVSEDVGQITYLQMQQHWDASFPAGLLRYWKSSFLETISEDVLSVCHEAIARQSLTSIHVDLEPMGGAIARLAPDATAFADRDAASTLLIATGWSDPQESDARMAWARQTWNAAQPFAKSSAYVNYLDQGEEQRTEAVYGANFRRLVEIKRKYDPTNVFRFNANIQP